MNSEDKKQALRWYCDGIELITIAQHFGLTRDELTRHLSTTNKG